ncbi:hypothetical protein TNCV_2115511 [Trichonephila clavipes]|nr:hypothetical protein TNCV_2115511 [Trichonephila clavipes]
MFILKKERANHYSTHFADVVVLSFKKGRKDSCHTEPKADMTSRCSPVVHRSLEHHTGDNTTFSSVPPQFRGRTPWGFKGLPFIFPFHQPQERTCGSRRLFRMPPPLP